MMFRMAYFPQPHYTVRAPRVRLSKPPKVLFVVENTRIEGILQKLSLTGGAARLRHDCNAGALAELKINTAAGHLEALVEMLPAPEIGDEHPFRFVAMGDADQQLLASTVTRLQKMGYAEGVAHAGF